MTEESTLSFTAAHVSYIRLKRQMTITIEQASRAGEMAQSLRFLAAHPEDPGQILNS